MNAPLPFVRPSPISAGYYAVPRSWYVCFSALFGCFNFFWAHRSIFLIPSPYACRGRIVLRFPTNSYYSFTVDVAHKGMLCTRLGTKGSLIRGYSPTQQFTKNFRKGLFFSRLSCVWIVSLVLSIVFVMLKETFVFVNSLSGLLKKKIIPE